MSQNPYERHAWAAEPIVIHRSDVERVLQWARENEIPRDYLILRLPAEIGLRTSEIAMLRIEDIDFEKHTFKVWDSKKHGLFPLPLDMVTLQLIQDLIEDREKGFVFGHVASWIHHKHEMPLSPQQIWFMTKAIGERAGVRGMSPRLLRAYFAAQWAIVKKKNLVILQRILRHAHLGITQIYVSKLTFFEDMQREYEDIQNAPFVSMDVRAEASVEVQRATSAVAEVCQDCPNLQVCKFAASMPECVTACRYKTAITAPLPKPINETAGGVLRYAKEDP
jgi:integrase